MISTIGSLVQVSSNRWRWLRAASLYTVACLSSATLLGVLLGAVGRLVRQALSSITPHGSFSLIGAWLVGMIAVAYALSDAGMMQLPRPTLRYAVPVAWWRQWRPYGAAIAYGAALGVGVMTRIDFGAFYVLCAWCVLKGDAIYGAVLMGTYGAARALVIFPASWGVAGHSTSHSALMDWLASPLFNQLRAQRIVACALIVFGAYVVISMPFAAHHALAH